MEKKDDVNPYLTGFPTEEQRQASTKLSDARKLRVLAAALDYEQFVLGRWSGDDGNTDVQDDLRRIAKKVEIFDLVSQTVAAAIAVEESRDTTV